MNPKAKLIGDDDERAVSPVIGVILMVAITVILAAVIATFVLELGQSQSASASASLQFNENSSSDVEVTWIDSSRIDDNTDLTINHDDSTTNLTSIGESTIVSHNDSTVTVTGEYQGERTTVATWSP